MKYKLISDRVLELLHTRITKLETEKDRLVNQNIELVRVLSRLLLPISRVPVPDPPRYNEQHIRPETTTTVIEDDIDAFIHRLSYQPTGDSGYEQPVVGNPRWHPGYEQ